MASPAIHPIHPAPNPILRPTSAPRLRLERRTRPELSVVIPVYNKEESITRALHSVLSQTFEAFEVVVVDDGSTDRSAEVVRAFGDPRVRLISQENAGVSVARNRGIMAARCEYVALIDADDEWAPNFLETMYDVLENRPAAKIVSTLYQVQDQTGEKRRALPLEDDELFEDGSDEAPANFFQLALRGQPLHASSVVLRRSFFAACGLFPAGVTHGEDLDMWLRVGLAAGDDGLYFTRRTHSIWHLDAENRAGNRRSANVRLPAADLVLANRRDHDKTTLEYAYLTLINQARRLRLSGYRWASIRRIWEARRTRHHRGRALRELVHALVDPRGLPQTA